MRLASSSMKSRYRLNVRANQRKETGMAKPNETRTGTEYVPITKELAAGYSTFHQSGSFDSLGNCRVWRSNGAMKTWKTRPRDFQLPVKHGLYNYGYVADYTAHSFHVDE